MRPAGGWNADDVVSEIKMARTTHRGSFLVLEGPDDERFWRFHAGFAHCQLVLAGGKKTVEDAVVRCDALEEAGVLGIVDDDYDSLVGRPFPSANLIRTEARDVEAMMLSSPAFGKVIHELGDAAKIAAFEQKEKHNVRDALVARALIFGRLRYLSRIEQWNVSFERKLPVFKYADVATWTFDRPRLIQDFATEAGGVAASEVERRLSMHGWAESPWRMIHGKDAIQVLAAGLRSALGNDQHPWDRIASMLRLAFDGMMFRDTRLYAEVKAWEAANPPFRILRL